MRAAVLVALGVFLTAGTGARQTAPARAASAKPVVVAEDRHDLSPQLRSMPALPPGSGALREVPRQSRPTHHGPRSRPLAPDPVAQTSPGAGSMPAASQSFEGIGNVDSVLPPDPNGAVGPNHYVQWVNLSFAIYSKGSATSAPTLIYGPAAGNTLWKGFGGPCESTNSGDPVVMYDHLADRWFMSQLAIPNQFGGIVAGPFYQCIAVSQTPDPTGAYYRYQFSFAKLNDYPKFSVWPDAYYMTMNQFTSVSLAWAGQGAVAYDRHQMLAGLSASMIYFDLYSVDVNLGGMLPASLDGVAPPQGSPAYFAQVDDDAWGYAPDELQIWQFHADWNQPSASTFTGPARVPTAPFDTNLCGYSRTCIPQPQTNAGLDALSDRLMYRLQYRNFGDHESLVVNHTVDADGTDHAGVRWYEVRDPRGVPSLSQQGTYAPDADNRWMASAAMDGAGNLALGFSVSSTATAPSIRYTGRLAGDPPGVMTQGESQLIAGGGSQTSSSGRWGDYSMLAIDPIDDCTFWYTQEYYPATSGAGWHTRVGSFAFPSCQPPSGQIVTVTASTPTATESGLTPGAFTFARTGGLTGPLTVSYSVSGTATAGSDYVALPGTVTFAAGQSSVTVSVDPIDDSLVEPPETVFVTINAGAAYRAGVASEAVVTIISDDAPPDLVVSAVSLASAVGGAGATITVTDTTANQATAPSTSSSTGFYLSTDFSLDGADVLLGSRSVPALAAGTSNAGTTVLTIPAGTASGTYYVIAKADYGNLIPETQEGNNTRWTTVRVGPDLTVSALTASTNGAAAGGSLTVTDTTSNSGGGSAAASTTAFYLSADYTLDPSDPQIGSRAVPALAAGASSTASTSVTIPPGTTAGTYYVFANADSANNVDESNELNNKRFSAAIYVGPDLVVSSVAGPAAAGAGDSIVLSDTTKNQGRDTAGPSTTSFYLSTNITFDAADVLLGSRQVPALASGAASSASTSLQLPAATGTGYYYVLAVADSGNQIAESVETNNVGYTTIRVGPDLIVSSVTAPAGAGRGDSIVIGDTTKNQGASAADASTTSFYLSTNAAFDAADVLIGSRGVPPLAAGAASAATTTVQIPASTPTGAYYVLAVADAGNQITESLESNNVAFTSIRIGPDLVVSSLGVPLVAGAGDTVTVADTTKNQGGGTTVPSTTAFYLSRDTLFDATDVPLGGRAVPALGAGEASAASTSVQIPPATATGMYYVLARADSTNAVVESIENNNLAFALVRVGPDLTVTALSVPSTAAAGSTIGVTDTTKNQGGAVAPASTTQYYLSTNLTLDASDILIGARAVGTLAPGTSDTGSATITLPPGIAAGTYYILAVADGPNTIVESVETNNVWSRAISITSGGE